MKESLKNAGITLVALVITIIILLILAGVTIGFAMNGNGLFDKAKYATETYNNKAKEEMELLENYENEITNYSSSYRDGKPKISLNKDALVTTICNETNYSTTARSYSYTATQDCVVVGDILCYSGGTVDLKINTINIGGFYTSDANYGVSWPVYYYLGNGDSIEFVANNGDTWIRNIRVYEVK